ncbi:hypothetical protein PIB30_036376 [Stylosanthes scabra]|uniref:Uncharacterized protein n=1 Tax=Stylosanthes scabra TaxID=79078 RepID=A0ABU6ZCQ3_9FABA|nr:hypothetical protein [Stylosanthes scabra]
MDHQQLEEAAREAANEMYRLDRIAHVSYIVTTECAEAAADASRFSDRVVLGYHRIAATSAS